MKKVITNMKISWILVDVTKSKELDNNYSIWIFGIQA